MVKLVKFLHVIFLLQLSRYVCCNKQPHIIFVLADDFGWNDVGFRNPDIKSPNIDNAAYNGIILNSSYVQTVCTPSRSAIMTGYYPHRNGMQKVILFFAEAGLPLQFKLLPQALKEVGYSTHLIGKWHLGSCNSSYHPFNRGFDTFFGYLGAGEHYYTHSYPFTNITDASDSYNLVYDFWNQSSPSTEYNGTYSSTAYMAEAERILENRDPEVPLFLFMAFQATHSPIEIEAKHLQWYPNEENQYRKNFSALVTQLDHDFSQLVDMLKKYGIYNDSIIIFTADNGAEVRAGGNNYPLRGGKTTLYEGGTRASAFIHSPLLKNTGYTYNGLMHVVDWYPTIVSLAGGSIDPNADGINVWNEIVNDQPSKRNEFVYSLMEDDKGQLHGAIRDGKWKLIFGNAGLPNAIVRPENVEGWLFNTCGGMVENDRNSSYFQLFNIDDDPTESYNLASTNVDIVNSLYKKAQIQHRNSVKDVTKPDNIFKYHEMTSDLQILNVNWCAAIEKVSPLN